MANTSNRGFASMDENKQREIASMGGKASSGKFGDKHGADPRAAGQKGAAAQPTEAKRAGGRNSHRGSQS
ncbi:MAG TPA: KGG domain-containing protein [Candidatus Saccharimonadales bacterium]|nr:KGG domain-containing protein [Candidatus Saccharimonadales bacterium]